MPTSRSSAAHPWVHQSSAAIIAYDTCSHPPAPPGERRRGSRLEPDAGRSRPAPSGWPTPANPPRLRWATTARQLRAVPAGHPDALIAWQPGARLALAAAARRSGQRACSICICRSAAPRRRGRSPSAISARASTASSPRTPATRSSSPATRTSCTCTACARSATPSSSAPAPWRPTIRSSRRGTCPARTRCASSSIPARRLADRLSRSSATTPAPTLYACARTLVAPGETHVGARRRSSALDDGRHGDQVAELLRRAARARLPPRSSWKAAASRCRRFSRRTCSIGCTWRSRRSSSATAGPRSACRRAPTLSDCHRPRYRVFRMGGDVLFDCDLRTGSDPDDRDGRHAADRPASSELESCRPSGLPCVGPDGPHSTSCSWQPRRQILVADDEARAAARDVREPARPPVADQRRASRARSPRPPPPSLRSAAAAARAASGPSIPVARFAPHLVAAARRNARAADVGGIRPERRAESLVGPLMPVHQLANHVVLRLVRRAAACGRRR